MIATNSSIILSRVKAIDGKKLKMLELRIKFLFNKIIMCPAIMFAVSRIVKVIGRMKNLISSIMNMKGTSKFGVLSGIR